MNKDLKPIYEELCKRILKIRLAAGTLRWKDQEVLAHLLYCFNLVKETYDLPSLISIFYSLALVSQSPEAFTLLAREIAA